MIKLILFNVIFKNERDLSPSYSSPDNLIPLIPASDWLIIRCK